MAVIGSAIKYARVPTAADTIKKTVTPTAQNKIAENAGVIGKMNSSGSNPLVPNTISMVNQQLQSQQQPQFDPMLYIKQLEQAKISQDIASIDKSYNNYVDTVNADKAKIQPKAYADRNMANVTMNNSNNAWNEYIANKYGSSKAGIQDLGIGMNLNAYQGEVGAINRNATSREQELDNQILTAQKNRLSDIQSAQAGASAQALQQQLNQYNADKQFNYQVGRDTVADNRYNQQYADDKANQAKQEFINTMGQYSNDYQAKINELKNDGDPTNDWQIPYVQIERNNKIANQQALEQKANEARTALQQQQFENALAAWKASGVASQAISQILGVPVGARTAAYNIDSINAATSRQKANTSAVKSSTPKAVKYNYKTDNDFAEDYQGVVTNPSAALALLLSNAQEFIQKYGYDGYQELLKKAQGG